MLDVKNKVSSLPTTQQIALWAVLRMSDVKKKDFNFRSSEFAEKFKRFSTNITINRSEEYGKFIGGVLSGLLRNGILRKLAGGRDKIWTLSEEVEKNFEEYKKNLFEVKKYWS